MNILLCKPLNIIYQFDFLGNQIHVKERALRFTNKIILLDKWFWKVIKSGPKRKIFERLDITKSCEAIENNQLKCSDYSIFFFNMHGWRWTTFQLVMAKKYKKQKYKKTWNSFKRKLKTCTIVKKKCLTFIHDLEIVRVKMRHAT